MYKTNLRRTAKPDLACYAALGKIESPKFREAEDWEIVKLQSNGAKLEENSFSRAKSVGILGQVAN